MATYHDPKPLDFRLGPGFVYSYKQVLKLTMVHGPKRVGMQVFVVPAGFDVNDPDQCVIEPPLVNPDDVSTIEGKVIHFNRIRMISASIKFHHEKDGSFPLSSREKVRYDMNIILNWPWSTVLFVVSPDEYGRTSMDYPAILEASWIGRYPDEPYIDIESRLESVNVAWIRLNQDKEPIYGPPTFAEHLKCNTNWRQETLQRLTYHREFHMDTYDKDFDAIQWCDHAIRCWHDHEIYVVEYIRINHVFDD
jgi:hypothetical protein